LARALLAEAWDSSPMQIENSGIEGDGSIGRHGWIITQQMTIASASEFRKTVTRISTFKITKAQVNLCAFRSSLRLCVKWNRARFLVRAKAQSKTQGAKKGSRQ